ncbi:TetR/AcrR family transcriptional regulator [Corallococcus llansteffanensis]|uniref:TetR/AcrR family transcriptional regulator n=1 Tax=Corallococcus llansteffanensis TaxID=2316731 RepID=A0A3A8PDT9_9BACT|nr:TetR/AcrR family transcriptional regulator [Corallococcus llansteffanensis]RKH54586.1 TetR/AcrR family transcriptional regulator [Corallococcus llansteffanensis]
MARPVTIQDEDILKAAREVFLERGMRATSVEIAARARVSPGILFKRFKTKEALFRAAMTPQGDPEHLLPIDLDARVGKGSVEDTLVELGTHLMDGFSRFIPTTMMAWSNRQEPEPAARAQHPIVGASERAAKRTRKVADYLAAEARLGRVREGDFDIVAQAFIGALWHHTFLQVMLDKARKQPASQQAYVRGVVHALWSGLAPERPSKR